MQNVDQCPISVPEITDTKGQRFDFLLFIFVLLRPPTQNLSTPPNIASTAPLVLAKPPPNGSAFLSIAAAVNGDTINI